MRQKKANVTLFFVFMIFVIIIIIITALMAPLAAKMSVKTYAFGEKLLNSTIASDVNDISNPDVRNDINESFRLAMANTQTNIEFSTGLFQYSWIVIILITLIFLILQGRALVELGRQGNGGFV